MKKSISVLVLLVLVSAGAFAQLGFAVGGGVLFDYSKGNGLDLSLNPPILPKVERTVEFENGLVGVFAFFGAKYFELAVSFGLDQFADFNDYELGLTLLGKYPLTPIISPMLGFSYNVVGGSYGYDNKGGINLNIPKTDNLNYLGILAGAGFDFGFSRGLFLKTQALFHYRFPSSGMKDLAELASKVPLVEAKANGGLGVRLTAGIGFRI